MKARTRNATKTVEETEAAPSKYAKKTRNNVLKEKNHEEQEETVPVKKSTRSRKHNDENIIAEEVKNVETENKTTQRSKRNKNKKAEEEIVIEEPVEIKKSKRTANKRGKNDEELPKEDEPVVKKSRKNKKESLAVEEVVVPKQTKRRGKNQVEISKDESVLEPIVEVPKKRRGRNAKIESEVKIETLPEQPNSPEIKKTRGRGKKAKNITTENVSIETEQEIVADSETNVIKSPDKPDNKSPNMNETYDVVANKTSDNRISGIEEIEMPSMIRDGTFIKNSTFDMSSNLTLNNSSKKKFFSAASPCKLFKVSTNASIMKTPQQMTCRAAVSVGSAGCTPMPRRKVSDPTSTPMIMQGGSRFEKKSPSVARSKVFFRSPNRGTPENVNQFNSTKLIKSNLKGSNKSFVHTNSDLPRKRSLPQNDKEPKSAKIRKLNPSDLNKSIDRLSRPKLLPAEVKSKSISRTPGSTAGCTPAKPKPAEKSLRSKIRMPDFASVHKKQFEQMESLVDNKARKEERAKLLLSASKGPFVFTSKGEPAAKVKGALYNRFGYRPDQPSKPADVASAASAPRSKLDMGKAKDIVMRQEQRLSIAEKTRSANKEYIKGVRTNKRFELQMKNRNMQQTIGN